MMEPMGGPKVMQWWGFVSIGVASLLVSLSYEKTGNGSSSIRTSFAIVACSFLIFTLNWGCNVSASVLARLSVGCRVC